MAKVLGDDRLWELIEPLLPPPKPRRFRYPGRKRVDDRKALTGTIYVGSIIACQNGTRPPVKNRWIEHSQENEMRLWYLVMIMAVALTVAAVACTSSTPATSPTGQQTIPVNTPPAAPSASTPEPPEAEPMSEDQEVFIAKGCAACHGQNSEGTDFAPALAGHTEGQIRRQVRAPVGIMPVFPPDKVSNDELAQLVSYITNLEGDHAHVRAEGPVTVDQMAVHHWMALFALDDGDGREGAHHVEHIIELTEGQHRSQMQKTLNFIEADEIENATLVLENMLQGLQPEKFDMKGLHLTMALSAIRVEDVEAAMQHVEHSIEIVTGPDLKKLQEIISQLDAGELDEAHHNLEAFMGEPVDEAHEAADHPDDDGDDDHDEDDDDHDEDDDDHDEDDEDHDATPISG